MGQYGNQPDFGTQADDDVQIVTKGEAAQRLGYLGGACLYIGTGGDINVLIAGTQGGGQSFDPIFFKTFMVISTVFFIHLISYTI